MSAESPAFDPARIIEVLDPHGVEYVMVGGFGSQLQLRTMLGDAVCRRMRLIVAPARGTSSFEVPGSASSGRTDKCHASSALRDLS